jgi:hypothetical protein|tara:strand:+ start:243 stop:500 length:258 start_codon:yes stop_codon:yes gene_type:complete
MAKSSGFKMKGNPMQRNFGISPMRNEERVVQEATGPEGGGGRVVKNQAMINLEENKPPVDSPEFKTWNIAYKKAVDRNKSTNAPE